MKISPVVRDAVVRAALFVAVALGAARSLPAQSASVVPVGDLAYRDVDRLVELGLLDSLIVGQRPWSRREFGRIVRMVRERLDRGGSYEPVDDWTARIERAGGAPLGRLEERFSAEADEQEEGALLSLVDGAALVFTSTNAARRPFPATHTRPIEATIDPLAEPRLAQPAARGNTTTLELSQRMAPSSWLAFYVRERIEYRAAYDSGNGRLRGELLLATLRTRFRNVALIVGRDALAWAQSEGDGLFFASDAPAFDQVRVQSDAPFVMPGPLRLFGPTRATLLVGALGPSAVRNDSRLLAYKVSIHPLSALELGGTFMNHFGGAGGRSSSFGDRLIDFLPLVDVFRRHNYTDSTRTLDVDSDKLLGADARLRLDRLAGMTIAGELLMDDFDVHSPGRSLMAYGSQTVRLIFPVVGTPDLSARLGAKHMGTITYSHFALRSGIATRGRLLGDELGPDAKEFSGDLRWAPRGGAALSLELREQRYSNAEYSLAYTDDRLVETTYTKSASTADERRHIAVASVVLRPAADLSFTLRAGVQVSENYAFGGFQRTDYVAGVALRLRQ